MFLAYPVSPALNASVTTSALIPTVRVEYKIHQPTFRRDNRMKTKIYIPSDDAHEALINAPNLTWEKIADRYPPSTGIDDWRGLHKSKHWRKFYSAYELAVSWEAADPFLPLEVQAWFGNSAELLAVIPEHKTPLPPDFHHAPSRSDALAFVRSEGKVYAVAVEGKVYEPFGPTVGKWRKGESDGKVERLKFICQTLGLNYPPDDEIRYQLLHRSASAVIEAERFHADCAAMIVHSFAHKQAPPEGSELLEDFDKFLSQFGIDQTDTTTKCKTVTPRLSLYFAWVSPKR